MIYGLIRDVLLALKTVLSLAALHASDAINHAACQDGTRVSGELAELL